MVVSAAGVLIKRGVQIAAVGGLYQKLVDSVGIMTARHIRLTAGPLSLCFVTFYESRFLHQIRQEAPPGLPGGPPSREDLRDQQDRSALQSTPGLSAPTPFIL